MLAPAARSEDGRLTRRSRSVRATSLHVPGNANAACLLWQVADCAAGCPAIIDRDDTVDYRALRSLACGFGRALEAAGVQADDRVVVLLERSADAAAAFFGAAAIGAVPVVVNEGLRPRQIEHILEHCAARVLISRAELLARQARRPTTSAAFVDAGAVRPSLDLEPVGRVEADVAQIIYTSGSTGPPKGVAVSHGNLHAGVGAVTAYLGITDGDRIAGLLPFSFDYGLNQLLCAVATGAALVVERSSLAARIVATLRAHDVTVLAAVPSLWYQLLDVPDFAGRSMPSLRVMTNTGARLATAAVRRLRAAQPQAKLFLMYGLTEAFRSTFLPPEEADRRPDSIGRAIPGAEVLVLRDDGTPCAPGEVGELVHRGPTVALGYWNDPEATARVFRPNPLRPRGSPGAERVVFSGDLARRDEDGFLYVVGRRDGMIKTLGYRVSPDEITEVLFASGMVREAVVGAEPDELRGQRIMAQVVLSPGGSLAGLQAFCRAELPRYMWPARIERRRRLARTAHGKYAAPSAAGRP
jgi:amino acid adenylation domain-containing protein